MDCSPLFPGSGSLHVKTQPIAPRLDKPWPTRPFAPAAEKHLRYGGDLFSNDAQVATERARAQSIQLSSRSALRSADLAMILDRLPAMVAELKQTLIDLGNVASLEQLG